MAKSKKTPATEPVLTCPFTGKPLEIVTVSDGLYFQARGEFYSTKLYSLREALVFDLSTRDGVLPAFARKTTIEVREVTPPETDPVADVRELSAKHAEVAGQIADEAVARMEKES